MKTCVIVSNKLTYNNITRNIMLICLSILIALPISIFKYDELDIPLAIIAFPISVIYFIKRIYSVEGKLITLCLTFSIVSIGINQLLVSESITIAPLMSLTYYFVPYFMYFAGYDTVRNYNDFKLVLSIISSLFVVVAVAICCSILLNGGAVRFEGELLGSILGFKLYGTYGVNSLAVYYAIMLATLIVYIYFDYKINYLKLMLAIPGMLCLVYLLLGSLSREAILGSIIFFIISIIALFKHKLSHAMIFTLLFIATLFAVLIFYGDKLFFLWSTKILVSQTAYGDKNIDELSSGRLTLIKIALSDIMKNPYFGNGFHGFGLYDRTADVQDIIGINNSPHNQYVTAVWKMGLIPVVFYFIFLFKCLKNAFLLQKNEPHQGYYRGIWLIIVIFFTVFCGLWDVLLVPLLGMFVMFILGTMSGIYLRTYGTRQVSRAQFGNRAVSGLFK